MYYKQSSTLSYCFNYSKIFYLKSCRIILNEKKEQENFDSATKMIDRFLLIIIIILSRIELYNDLQRRNYIMSNLRFWIIDLDLIIILRTYYSIQRETRTQSLVQHLTKKNLIIKNFDFNESYVSISYIDEKSFQRLQWNQSFKLSISPQFPSTKKFITEK